MCGTLTYFLNLTKGSYQQELDNFFAVTHSNPTPTQVVTKSALTQALKHLSHTAFIDLNHQVVNGYYTDHPDIKTWKGFWLCAIDGSRLRVPNKPDIIETFGVFIPAEKVKKTVHKPSPRFTTMISALMHQPYSCLRTRMRCIPSGISVTLRPISA